MRGKKLSPLQRATEISAINEGASFAEVNPRLRLVGEGEISERTYEDVKGRYLPVFKERPDILAQWIEHPMKLGQLPHLAAFRQDRRLTKEEEKYFESLPEWMKEEVLQQAPTYTEEK